MKQKKRNSFAVLGYTKDMMAPMVAFALTGQGVTDEFVLSHEEQTGRRR